MIVASVSSIYGLGSPQEYRDHVVSLRVGMEKSRDQVVRELIANQYERNDLQLERSRFRVRGDVLEIYPASATEQAVRVEFFGDEIERIREIDTLTGEILAERNHIAIFPPPTMLLPVIFWKQPWLISGWSWRSGCRSCGLPVTAGSAAS